MRRSAPALLLLLALAPAALRAQATLFLTSTPIRATVYLDGAALPRRTPVLLRQVAPGPHVVVFRKADHTEHRAQIELAPEEIRVVEATLAPLGIGIAAAGATTFTVSGQPLDPTGAAGLPAGSYALDGGPGSVVIQPLYPGREAIAALNVAVPLALGIAALSTLQDVVYARGSAAGLSPLTITSYVASAAALGLNISLRVAQSRHRRAFAVASRSRADPALEIQTLERAETELSQGRLADALSLYLQNVRQRPDSGSLPLSLYQIARIHQLQGELDLAELELRLIVDVYPDPAVFDRSQKALADVLSTGGKYAQALEALDAMVMLDPLYVPEEIAAYRTEILERLVQTEPSRRAEIEAAGRRARGSES